MHLFLSEQYVSGKNLASKVLHVELSILQITKVELCYESSCIFFYSCRYGLPQSLRPPEAYFHDEGTWPVKADMFDSWSIGILILELFTGSYLSKKMPKKVCNWTKQAYPIIYDVLKVRGSYYYE